MHEIRIFPNMLRMSPQSGFIGHAEIEQRFAEGHNLLLTVINIRRRIHVLRPVHFRWCVRIKRYRKSKGEIL